MRLLIQLLLAPTMFRLSTRRSTHYLDATNGSMILQVLLGGTAGIAVMLRMFWRQFTGVFRFGRKSEDEASVTDE